MPNWVSNVVKCDNRQALLRLRDFNLIVPEHPSIVYFSDWVAQHAAQLFQQGKSWQAAAADADFVSYLTWKQENTPARHQLTPARAARRYLLYYKVHGYVDWYDWRCEHWGSKWNAYHYRHQGSEAWFETALMHPYPVIAALSRKFPDTRFCVSFADEDLGNDTGAYDIRNGELLCGGELDNGSREAYELAFSHWGGEEGYKLVDDTYYCQVNAEETDDDTGTPSPVV